MEVRRIRVLGLRHQAKNSSCIRISPKSNKKIKQSYIYSMILIISKKIIIKSRKNSKNILKFKDLKIYFTNFENFNYDLDIIYN